MGHELDLFHRELIENLPIVNYVDEPWPNGRTLFVSPQVEEMLGYPVQAWLDDPDFIFTVLHPDDREWMRAKSRNRDEFGNTSLVFRVIAKDGRVYTVQSERALVHDESGAPVRALGFWIDITERVRLADQLRQAQKLEALGRLAGGIAHDFNNILLAQQGFGELALRELEDGDEAAAASSLADMLAAGDRAADLTRQLLAFARRQVLELAVLDLNAVVSDFCALLCRLIGEDVTLVTELAAGPIHVRGDRTQLQQVLTNLALNARDAMPQGGQLTIATSTDADGNAVLEVSDTGAGMDDATAAHMFEPFFTTKANHGTGLGLATVHGIVTQSCGSIDVRTAAGSGTTFTIVLPTTDAPVTDSPAVARRQKRNTNGRRTILLVEDDDSVRAAVGSMLDAGGHTVLAASDGLEAVELAHERGDELDLLLTDLVMPSLGGRETAAIVRELHPELPVVYMTGHAEEDDMPREPSGAGTGFLRKPFSGEELMRILEETSRSS